MKFLVCFCTCVSVVFGLHAQNTFPTPGGNVGIGTTTPSENLTIGTETPSDANTRKAIRFGSGGYGEPGSAFSGSNGDKLILFDNSSANYDGRIGVGTHGNLWMKSLGIGGSGGMFEWYGGSSTTSPLMVLTGLGRVGMGTSNPLYRLHIKLDNDFIGIQRSGISNYSGHYYFTGPDNNTFYNFFVGLRENSNNFHIFNAQTNSDALTIVQDNSFIGINTMTPNAPLSLGNGIVAQKLLLFDDNNNAKLGLGIQPYELRVFASDDAHISFGTVALSNGTTWSEKMRIDNSGNVSIGTADSHGFKLAVNGNIRAQEIKVEAGPWPDYVFKPGYKLPSLSDLQSYINKNQHLPEIPSEADVTKGGVNLGEMNKLLVKKVEELTLYLIEQAKQNDELKKRFLKLESTITKRKQ